MGIAISISNSMPLSIIMLPIRMREVRKSERQPGEPNFGLSLRLGTAIL